MARVFALLISLLLGKISAFVELMLDHSLFIYLMCPLYNNIFYFSSKHIYIYIYINKIYCILHKVKVNIFLVPIIIIQIIM